MNIPSLFSYKLLVSSLKINNLWLRPDLVCRLRCGRAEIAGGRSWPTCRLGRRDEYINVRRLGLYNSRALGKYISPWEKEE